MRQKIRKTLLLISFLLFPATFYYLSPVISLYGASLGIVSGSLMIFLGMLVASPFLGRAFCGWLCPAGALQDFAGDINARPFGRGKIRLLKYLVWAPWLGGVFLFFFLARGVKEANFTFATVAGLSVTSVEALTAYLLVGLVFLILPLLAGRRAACHTLCWMAPFMIIGRKAGLFLNLPALRLSGDRNRCISCGRCTRDCPMGLPVQTMVDRERMDHSDCILCGLCADHCPASCLSLKFLMKKS